MRVGWNLRDEANDFGKIGQFWANKNPFDFQWENWKLELYAPDVPC
jgi:hypothetical protein